MTTPNGNCIIFCQWLISNKWLRFSPSQLNLISIIKAAAVSGTQVSATQWKDFLNTTMSRYQIYLQSVALSVQEEDDMYYYQ